MSQEGPRIATNVRTNDDATSAAESDNYKNHDMTRVFSVVCDGGTAVLFGTMHVT